MGTLALEPVPDRLKHELRDEPVLFAVRQKRLISKGGAIGGAAFGVLVAAFGAFALGSRGDPNVTIDLAGLLVRGGTSSGDLVLLLAGILAILAGVGMIAIAPVLYRMPGDLAVGTPTRLFHVGRWKIHTLRWRDVDRVRLEEDGSVGIRRFAKDAERSFDIVQPPRADEIVALVGGLVAPARPSPIIAAVETGHVPESAPAAAPSEPVLRFRSTHKGAGRGLMFGIPFALLGVAATIAFGATLLTGGTISASVNDGPMREVGAAEAEAWTPVGIGALFTAVGLGLMWLGMPRRFVTEYEIHGDGLYSRDAWGLVDTVEWRVFTGEIQRREGRRGVELRLPLRTTTTSARGRTVQASIEMIGVENADAAEAELRRRLA